MKYMSIILQIKKDEELINLRKDVQFYNKAI